MSTRPGRRLITCVVVASAAVFCCPAHSTAGNDPGAAGSPGPSSRKLTAMEKAERTVASRQMSAGGYWAHLAATGRLPTLNV